MNTVIPIFHKRKHKSPLSEVSTQDGRDECTNAMEESEERLMFEHLNQNTQSDFISNILFYIGGFIVSKLIKKLTCQACKDSLLGSSIATVETDHDYCGLSAYDEVSSASAFTLFVNNGGLRIPSKSVFSIIEQCEHVFKQYVCQNGISSTKNLKSKMILQVCHYFLLESNKAVFSHHELSSNVVENDHQTKLIKWTADKYFTMRLFTYGKKYSETVVQNGMPSSRHQLNKLILFKNL